MTSDSEWQVITVSHPASYDASVVLNSSGIKRSDGFTLIRIGLGRENQETFLCKGAFEEFQFTTSRWNELKNEPTDTYVIYLSFFGKPIAPKSEIKDRIILSHAKDIEAALLHFPPIEFSNFKPMHAKRIVFHVTHYSQNTLSSTLGS